MSTSCQVGVATSELDELAAEYPVVVGAAVAVRVLAGSASAKDGLVFLGALKLFFGGGGEGRRGRKRSGSIRTLKLY